MATSLRVLVVDDRRDSVMLLQALLNRAGHEVRTAENGADGLEAARQFAPHVVISDLGLGGPVDGCAFISAVRADPTNENPFFIAVTGYDDDEHRRSALAAGFHHYLVKPAPIEELLSVLSQIQARRGE